MAKALKLSDYTNVGAHRATNLGSSVAFTAYGEPSIDGVISYILDVEDGVLVPRSIGDEDSGYAFAPFLDADGQVLAIKGLTEILETLGGSSRDLDIPNQYAIQALALENGSVLVLSHAQQPRNDGANSGIDSSVTASLSLLTWNDTFDAYDRTAHPLTLPSSLTSSVQTFRYNPGKMVTDGEGQVHWILPTVNATSTNLADYEHLIINGTAPYVHHVGAVTGLRASYHQQQLRLGLDAGGRPSHVLRAQQPVGGPVRTQCLGRRVHNRAPGWHLCDQSAPFCGACHRHCRALDRARDRNFGHRRNAALCASAARGPGR